MNHWSWSLPVATTPQPQTTVHSNTTHTNEHLLTCSQIAPVMVTGKGLTLPRPRFSLFLWLLKSFSSRFSSSSRPLQYRTCTTRAQVSGVAVNMERYVCKWWHAQTYMHSEWWPFCVRAQADLTSLSCGGSWCRSCLMRCFSPGLFTYGTLSSGKEL